MVDDEPVSRRSCEKVLIRHGYDVITVNSGQQALDRLAEEGFDLIITDLKMAGLGGMQLIERIQGICPETPIVVISGYITRNVISEVLELGVKTFVPKPFTTDELLSAVGKALGTTRPAGSEDGG